MTDDAFEHRRKRLIFRSWHRGTREMDFIMGRFAEKHVPAMDEVALTLYEELLNTPDPDVYDWVSGQKPVPANLNNEIVELLIRHEYAPTKNNG